MSKKLKDLKWDTVAVEGFPVSFSDKFQGFVGLEECTDYALDKETKKIKKKQKKMKKKRQTEDTTVEIPSKKLKTEKETVRLSNGFLVESCEITTPSFANEKDMKSKKGNTKFNNSIKKKEAPKKAIDKQRKCNINKKPKLGECMNETISDLTPEDMLTWAEFKLQEPIMKALTELGFKKPTKIQELTLPAAIHGRRDILGAAETGSGKTLAFGLPILSGIMKLKEKAELGHDVYELPYKKTSVKKKVKQQERNKNNARTNRDKKRNEQKLKESSEDGYGTDEGSDDSKKYDNNRITNIETQLVNNKSKNIQSIKDKHKPGKKVNNDDDYLEEFNVPIKTRKLSVDEDDDSDDSENYTHLSEMIDSDDLDETSDDDNVTANCIESGDTDEDEKTDQLENASSSDDDEIDDESNEDNTEEINENEQGMGCVKVIDNVEIPGHVVIKTGKLLYALILTPTRELAMQISRHLMAVAKYTGIKVATVVGGMAVVKQERVLRSGPEVVVATPGRLWELINQGQPHLQQLNSVKFLAIDETDRMIERGHFEELHPLLERLNSDDNTRGARQNFVFSATLTMVHDLPTHMKRKKVTKRGKIINRRIEKMTSQQKIKRLINMIGMTDPKVVDITTSNLGTAETLTESRITCSLEHKDAYLYYIIKRHPGRTIVFCNSIGSVRRLAQLMSLLKCNPLPLHASMPQRQRLKNLERFRDDPHGVLVATDVAARGLDIPNVDHVIHYQVPKTAENYVHRSGRTARATKEGLTILMMEPSEAYLYAKLCQTLNKTSELPTFPVVPQCLSSFKELVSLARTVDGLLLKKRRATQASGWRDKAAKDMDMIIDDDDLPVKQVDPSIDKELQIRKRQVESLLSRPMFPKGFSFKYPTLNDTLLVTNTEENALQVMKKALESGQLKKEKRKSKNAPLLKLQKN
ncbi:unnamed protein product [Diatraea saccharalis]|uniref:ATP-dependent RNA helicase n=1 Tax=Diatraea saccharalis TaxID=40085 RepID=A0A9P0C209_9NEOP|nr:unnamed protein product [Diatraea saccharalis]